MKSMRWLVIGGVACAACCAPLFGPVMAWLGLAGVSTALGSWAMGVSLEQIACALAGFLLVVGAVLLTMRSRRRREAVASCEIGASCDPSGSRRGDAPMRGEAATRRR